MITRQALPANRITDEARKTSNNESQLVPAAHVKHLLRELAVALHATKAVGWKGGAIAPKKG